jgi:hypothetical protein
MTIESTLTHGLVTSVAGSAYKADQDANWAKLDPGRIRVDVYANIGAANATGIQEFFFAADQKRLYYTNGTAWTEFNSATATACTSIGIVLATKKTGGLSPAPAGNYGVDIISWDAPSIGALTGGTTFTIPATGHYLITATYYANGPLAGDIWFNYVYKNGTPIFYRLYPISIALGYSCGVDYAGAFTVGDTVDIRGSLSTTPVTTQTYYGGVNNLVTDWIVTRVK